MSGITGKGATSIKKQEVRESRIPAIGFDKVRFLHKMVAGDKSISLTSLTAPSVSEAPSYSAPNVSQLTAVNLAQFPNNLELVSSIRGRLMRNMAYDIAGASTISLLFDAEDGEIIEGTIDAVAVTGNTLVDAKPLVASGPLLAGATDFNVGEPFEVGKNPLTQHGSVLVFMDNQLMYRNTGNQAPGPSVEGDYREVHAGSGLGTIIRFNTPDLVNDRNISVVSVAALAERPNGSMMAFIENVNGKVDSMIPTLAALAEVDESNFGGVTNVDLKAFGDRVLFLEGILNLEIPIVTNPELVPSVAAGVWLTGVTSNPSYGTTTINKATVQRFMQNAVFQWTFQQTTAGGSGSGPYLINLPYDIDLGAFGKAQSFVDTSFYDQVEVGSFSITHNGSNSDMAVAGKLYIYDKNRLYMTSTNNGNTSVTVNFVGGGAFNYDLGATASMNISAKIEVPVLGWTATKTIRELLGL